MKKCKKILSLVLALVMLLSVMSVSFTSFASVNKSSTYTTDALKGTMLADDKYPLTWQQYAVMMMDLADKALTNAGIAPMSIPLGAEPLTINMTSQSALNKTIMDLNALISQGIVQTALGDVGSMDFNGFSTATDRETSSTGEPDVKFITAFVNLVNNDKNNQAIGKILNKGIGSENGQFSLGVANSFVTGNKDISAILDDPIGFIKKTLEIDTFDGSIGTIVSDLINSLEMEMLEGYTFSQTDSIYTTIDKLVRVISRWAIKNLQADTWHIKDNILNAIPDFEEQYPFIKLDNITEFTWDWQDDGMGTAFNPNDENTYIIYHINNLIGAIVNCVIPEYASFKGSFSTAGWEKDASSNSLTTLNKNIAKAAQFADIKLNDGGSFTADELATLNVSDHMTKSYAMVLADALLRMFFPSIKVSKSDILAGNMCVLAVQALNEFFTYYLPEEVLSDLYDYTDEGPVVTSKYTETYCRSKYKEMGAKVIAKFLSAYLPVVSSNPKEGEFVFTNRANIDTVLNDLAKYFLNTVCKAGTTAYGALGTYGSSDTAYTAIDRIIFSLNTSGAYIEGCTNGGRNVSGILPEGLLPDAIPHSGHTHTTSKDLIDHLFNCIETLDFGAFLKLLVPNKTNTEMNTAILPNLGCLEVIRIINVFFPGSFTAKQTSLDALLTRSVVANLLQNILDKLSMDYHVYPALKLVANLTGLASAQTRGEANVSLAQVGYSGGQTIYTTIDPVIESGGTSIPSDKYFIRVENTSKGINGGYHDTSTSANQEYQWIPYKLKVTSITCETDSSVQVKQAGGKDIDPDVGVTIDSNSEDSFKIIGPAQSGNKILTFVVKYNMLAENGRTPGITQEDRINVYLGTQTYTTLESNDVQAQIPTTVYASPAMLSNTLGAAIAKKANTKYTATSEGTTFPSALENAGFKFSVNDIGIPTSTSGTQYKPFTCSAPSGENIADQYAGTYTINYVLKTKNSEDSEADYGTATSANISWVLFNDAGLPSAVSKYQGMGLQQSDYPNATLWNNFQTALSNAVKMIASPSKVATTPAALKAAFAAQVETLDAAYKALAKSSTVDYTESLKQRLVEYSDGDAENNIRAKYSMWDYSPVSWARYSSSLSTVKDYYNTNETSTIKVTEALRFNKQMAEYLFTNATIRNTSTPAAKNNLSAVLAKYSDTSKYNSTNYTVKSMEAILEAIEDANKCLDATNPVGLDGKSAPKISDYADARVALVTSVNQLVKQPLDVAALIQKVDQTNATYNEKMYYSEESWDALQAAIKAAEDEVINDPFSLLPDDYTSADIATANALIQSKYIPDIDAAIAGLKEYVSKLLPGEGQEGVKTFSIGDKLVIGSKTIEVTNENNFVMVYYGAKAADLNNHNGDDTNQEMFTFSRNVTSDPENRGHKNDLGQWVPDSYGNDNSEMRFAVYKNSTLSTKQTGNMQTGNVIKVYKDGFEDEYDLYTVVVTGNVSNKAVSSKYLYGTNKATSTAAVKAILPTLINSVDTGSISAANALACDLNQDGMVDVTDLVMFKIWESGAKGDKTCIKFPYLSNIT